MILRVEKAYSCERSELSHERIEKDYYLDKSGYNSYPATVSSGGAYNFRGDRRRVGESDGHKKDYLSIQLWSYRDCGIDVVDTSFSSDNYYDFSGTPQKSREVYNFRDDSTEV